MSLQKRSQDGRHLKIISSLIIVLLITPTYLIIEGAMVSQENVLPEAVRDPILATDSNFKAHRIDVDGDTDWISYDTSIEPGTPAEAHVTLSDTLGLRIVADFYGYWNTNITLNHTEYNRPDIPGVGFISVSGMPELPRFTKIVEVPYGVDISMNVLHISKATIENYNIAPVQPPTIPIWNPVIDLSDYTIVNNIGTENEFYPAYNTSTEGETSSSPIIMRGRRLLLISFYPIHYNPFTHQLKLFSKMEIDLSYNKTAQIKAPSSSLKSPAIETVFKNTILNYENWDYDLTPISATPPPFITSDIGYSCMPEGAEYLIIVDQDFLSAAERLAAWKTRKGVPTRVFTTLELGTDNQEATLTEIHDFIQNEAYSWDKAPEYILLFGDSDHIPTFYETEHPDSFFRPYSKGDRKVATDLYYFTVDGPDIIPDIYYGRISVDSLEQANAVVSKIKNYEISPPAEEYEEFYNGILTASFYQDYYPYHESDGWEDTKTGFIRWSEMVSRYFRDTGYNVHLNYTTNSTFICYPQEPLLKDIQGDDIPDFTLDEYPNFRWIDWDDFESSKSNIIANFDEGRIFVVYFDHGCSRNMYREDLGTFEGFDGWAEPRFTSTYMGDLSNDENRLPFVFSAACNVGWFDGETDQENSPQSVYSRSYECLSETLLREPDAGAIAVVGATRFSYNILSYFLLNGTIHAFWPSSRTPEKKPIYEFGAALQQGRLNVIEQYGLDDDILKVTLEMYHLFGDPETSLWTETPSNFSISYPTQIGTADNQRFVVRVNDTDGTPIQNATVCIQKGEEVYKANYTNEEGYIVFEIPTCTPGEMNITVTMHNFRPFLSTIQVVDSSPTLVIIPEMGPGHVSLTFNIDGFDSSYSVKIYMENTYLTTIPQNLNQGKYTITTHLIGPINVKANQSNPVTSVAIALYFSIDGPEPYIYSQWDPLTWHLAGQVRTYNNPCIQLYEVSRSTPTATISTLTTVSSHQLILGQEYLVNVTVWNSGIQEATHTMVNLSFAHWGAGVPWTKIDSPQYVDVDPASNPFDPSTHGYAFAYFTWFPSYLGHQCLRANISLTSDINPRNNEGQENADVLEAHSPAITEFVIGNPTEDAGYPYIVLRQESYYNDIWNTSISNYTSKILASREEQPLKFCIDLNDSVDIGEWRIFIVELFYDGELVGGFQINVTKVLTPTDIGLPFEDLIRIVIVIAGVAVLAVIVLYILNKRN